MKKLKKLLPHCIVLRGMHRIINIGNEEREPMGRNRTLVLLKPDAIHRNLTGTIIARFEQTGLKLCGAKLLMLNEEQFYALYPTIKGKPFHDQFRAVMFSGPCLALVLEGHEAVRAVFALSGPARNPEEDNTMSIRKSYALWTGADVVHRADSVGDAERQIKLFFSENELCTYYKLGEEFSSEEAWAEYGARWGDSGHPKSL
jgi:nucleoside-diphosphate kinase